MELSFLVDQGNPANLPKNWESILHVGNTAPPLTLRVNKRKTTVEGYLADLEAARTSGDGDRPYAIRLDNPLPVYRIPGFSEGLVSVQDAAAQPGSAPA